MIDCSWFGILTSSISCFDIVAVTSDKSTTPKKPTTGVTNVPVIATQFGSRPLQRFRV